MARTLRERLDPAVRAQYGAGPALRGRHVSVRRRRIAWLAAVLILSTVGAAAPPTLSASARATGSGDLEAQLLYNSAGRDDVATSVASGPGGQHLYVTGSSLVGGGGSNWDFTTIAYDVRRQAVAWTASFDGGASTDTSRAMAVSPDGSLVFVSGQSDGFSGSGNFDIVITALDAATGRRRWVASYDGADGLFDSPEAIAVSPDGTRLFVTGQSTDEDSSSDFVTIAYRAATGAELWASRYDGPVHGWDVPASIGVDPQDSRVFVTGLQRESPDNDDYATVAYDGAAVFVTGTSGKAIATVAYRASDGATIWDRRTGQRARFDFAQALAMSPDGSRLFVVGGTSSMPSSDGNNGMVIAYDVAAGSVLWVARRPDLPGDDAFGQVVVSPDGAQVVAAGHIPQSVFFSDYLTESFDATTGDVRWVRRRRRGSDDRVSGLAISPDGSHVYVGGTANQVGNVWSFMTLVYAA